MIQKTALTCTIRPDHDEITVHLIGRELPGEGLEAACCGLRTNQVPLGGHHKFVTDRTQISCPQWMVWANAVIYLGEHW